MRMPPIRASPEVAMNPRATARLMFLPLLLALLLVLPAAPATAQLGDLQKSLKTQDLAQKEIPLEGVSAETLADLKAMGALGGEFGAIRGGRETAFDIYRDTPSFDNWGGKSFINKGGTCLGMDVIVKHFHENIQFRSGPVDTQEQLARALLGQRMVVSGYADFREMSEKREAFLKNWMVAGHLQNFHPDNIVKGIGNLFGGEFPRLQRGLILENLRLGKPAIIGIYNSKSPQAFGRDVPVVRKLENGHAIMAWKSVDFERKTLFFIYDPNVVYQKKALTHRKYALVFDKSSKLWSLHPASYKSWYADWYPDHLLVVNGNTMFDTLRSEYFRAVEAVAEGTKKAVDGAVDLGRKAIDAGREAAEGAARRAGQAWDGLKRGVGGLIGKLF